MPLPRRLARTTAALALAVSTSLVLSACSPAAESDSASGADAPSASNNPSDAQFPITVSHAFGETVIEKKPERVATVGWGNQDVALAHGIVPVGMPKITWGDNDDDGIFPWAKEKIEELGGQTPVLFDETDGIQFEAVANTKPDVILAAYSGLTQEDYDTLSKIAPVIAYPETAWVTDLDDMIRLNSAGLGLADEGEEMIQRVNNELAAVMDKYPDLEGKKTLFTSFGGTSDPSKIGFYTTDEPRAAYLQKAGLAVPQVVKDNSTNAEQFWVEVSAERPELFDDVDLIVSYSSGDAEADKQQLEDMQADPLLSRIPAIADGHVAFIPEGPVGAAANPTPLDISWGAEELFGLINDGLAGNGL